MLELDRALPGGPVRRRRHATPSSSRRATSVLRSEAAYQRDARQPGAPRDGVAAPRRRRRAPRRRKARIDERARADRRARRRRSERGAAGATAGIDFTASGPPDASGCWSARGPGQALRRPPDRRAASTSSSAPGTRLGLLGPNGCGQDDAAAHDRRRARARRRHDRAAPSGCASSTSSRTASRLDPSRRSRRALAPEGDHVDLPGPLDPRRLVGRSASSSAPSSSARRSAGSRAASRRASSSPG